MSAIASQEIEVALRLKDDGNFAASLKRSTDQIRTGIEGAGNAASAASTKLVGFGEKSSQVGRRVQQAGYQVGDFAVQVASGQSALVAFTQQGSQVLGAFGPWGAVLGAAAAILGAFVVGMTKGSEAAKTLEQRTDALGESISDLQGNAIDGVKGLSGIVETYGAMDAQLVSLIQRQTQFNSLIAKTRLAETLKAIPADIGDRLEKLVGFGAGEIDFVQPNASANMLLQTLGMTEAQAADTEAAIRALSSATSISGQSAALADLGNVVSSVVSPGASEGLVALAVAVNDATLQVREYEEAQRDAAEAGKLLSSATPDVLNNAVEVFANRAEAKKSLTDLARQERELEKTFKDFFTRNAQAVGEFDNSLLMLSGRTMPSVISTSERLASSFEDSFGKAFSGIVSGTQTVEDAFRNMANAIIQELFRITVQEQLMAGIGQLFRAGLGAVFGTGGTSTVSAASLGNPTFGTGIAAGGGVSLMSGVRHGGGIAGDFAPANRNVSADLFSNAPRFHKGGIVPGEVPIIAKQGEEIGWPGDLAKKYGGGGDVVVNQTNNFSVATAQTVRAQVLEMLPAIVNATTAAVANKAGRSRSYSQALG